MADTTQKTPQPVAKKRRRRWGRIVLLVMLIPVLAAAVMMFLLRSDPAHWKRHQAYLESTTPEQRREAAREVVVRLEDLANLGLQQGDQRDPSGIAIDQEVTVVLSEPDLKVLIDTQLQKWMDERGYVMPGEVRDPILAIEGKQLVLAFEVSVSGFSQVLSAYFDVQILEDGMAEMQLDTFQAGQLPIPANQLGKWLRDKSGDERLAQAGEWLSKLRNLQFKPVMELENRRRARVVSFTVLPNGIEATLRVQDHLTYKSQDTSDTAIAGVDTGY